MSLLNLRIQNQSTEYVPAQVTATKNGQAYNPTGDNVYFWFGGSAASPTTPATVNGVIQTGWIQGTWETAGTAYIANGLVGPANSGMVLATGIYSVWVQVTDNPEVPIRKAGTLTVYS
jgi:hypothetical protein